MSHLVKTTLASGEAPIKNLTALQRAVLQLQLLWNTEKKTVNTWSSSESAKVHNDLAAVIQHPEGGYELGVIPTNDGWTFIGDNMSSNLTSVVGSHTTLDNGETMHAPKLMQHYYYQAALMTAHDNGDEITRQWVDHDGSIVLEIDERRTVEAITN